MKENEVKELLGIKPKPETKQEMAEWLAEHVLGWERLQADYPKWRTPRTNVIDGLQSMIDFIYSPDGFFAVWDRVINEEIKFEPREEGGFTCIVGGVAAFGKDRYEAFYNALYDAWQ